ncbi:MAG: hypothetical protein ACK52P_17815 [Alphaproteobacteria bacterium]
MAHFAEIDAQGLVLRVIVISNADAQTHGQDDEAAGIAFCQSLFGADTRWVQTSYTGKKRRRFAGIGSRYDVERDAFIAPQPFPSWRLDETAAWVAPTPMPDDGGQYIWDEAAQYWKPLP